MSPKWLLVILLAAGLGLDYLMRLALFSVLPLWRNDLRANDLIIGLVASSFLWVYGALSPLAGYLGDRFSRRSVVIASVAGWSLVALLTGLVTAGWQMVVLRVLMAILQVSYMPVAQALLADFHDSNTRGRASGYFQMGSSVGIFASGLPAAWVAARWGWRSMMVSCGAVGILFALTLLRWLPSVKDPSHAAGMRTKPFAIRELRGLLRIPSMLSLMAAFTMTSIAYWILFSYLPLFVYERYHVSLESAAFDATFYMQAAAVALMPAYATLLDRWSISNPRNRYLGCAIVSLLGLPALVAVGFAHRTAFLISGLCCFGLVMASSDSSWLAMLCNVIGPRQRATAYGLLNFSGTLAGGAVSLLAALMMKRVGLGIFIGAAGLMYVLIAGLFLLCGYVLLERDSRSTTNAVAPMPSSPMQSA